MQDTIDKIEESIESDENNLDSWKDRSARFPDNPRFQKEIEKIEENLKPEIAEIKKIQTMIDSENVEICTLRTALNMHNN